MIPMPKINPQIQKWLKLADDDEKTCESILKHRDAPPAPVCFFSQQMAEKYLKALLILHGKPVSKIHDLKRLATLLESAVPDIAELENSFNILNKFYITTRYPAEIPEGFSWKDAEEAFVAARMVKEFSMKKIK